MCGPHDMSVCTQTRSFSKEGKASTDIKWKLIEKQGAQHRLKFSKSKRFNGGAFLDAERRPMEERARDAMATNREAGRRAFLSQRCFQEYGARKATTGRCHSVLEEQAQKCKKNFPEIRIFLSEKRHFTPVDEDVRLSRPDGEQASIFFVGISHRNI